MGRLRKERWEVNVTCQTFHCTGHALRIGPIRQEGTRALSIAKRLDQLIKTFAP